MSTTAIPLDHPALNTPTTITDMQPLGGLIFDPAASRWTVRTDLGTLPADQAQMIRCLLAHDNPADDHNPFRSKANAHAACHNLSRRAECEQGDEARAY